MYEGKAAQDTSLDAAVVDVSVVEPGLIAAPVEPASPLQNDAADVETDPATGEEAGANTPSGNAETVSAGVVQTEDAAPSKITDSSSAEAGKSDVPQLVVLKQVTARLQLEVDSVHDSRKQLLELTRAYGGHVSQEDATIESWQNTATLTVRVPVEKTETALAAFEKLGRLTHREIQAEDISKQFFDARLRLKNLRTTLSRYEQLLQQAEGVEQMLPLEKEMARVRGEIEQVEGTLAFLTDRGRESTIFVSLIQHTEDNLDYLEPEPRFYPGLSLGGAFDLWRPDASTGDNLSTHSYLDLRLSLGFVRQFGLDVDLLLDPTRTEPGVDGGVVTLGGHFYSEYFGDGKAKWMEPNIGLRAGYSLLRNVHEFTAGATFGIDIYKTERVRFLLDNRFSVLAGKLGVHGLYQPSLGIHLGF